MSPLPQRMIEEMKVRNPSPATQRSYVNAAVVASAAILAARAHLLGIEDVYAYQVHFVSHSICWSQLTKVVCALRSFYGVTLGCSDLPERIPHAKEPRKLPVVLS